MRSVHTARAVAVAAIVASTAASSQTSQVTYWPNSIVKRAVANAAALPTCDAERENWVYAIISEDEWRWCQAGSWVALGGGAPPSASEVPITDAGGYFAETDVEAALAEFWSSLAVIPTATVATLPACGTAEGDMRVRWVTDADGAGTCSLGGGATRTLCWCFGGASLGGTWYPIVLPHAGTHARGDTDELYIDNLTNGCDPGTLIGEDGANGVECVAAGTGISIAAAEIAVVPGNLNVEDFATADTNAGYVMTSDGLGGVAFEAAAGGGIDGSTGTTDDVLLCADGTGGSTLRACSGRTRIGSSPAYLEGAASGYIDGVVVWQDKTAGWTGSLAANQLIVTNNNSGATFGAFRPEISRVDLVAGVVIGWSSSTNDAVNAAHDTTISRASAAIVKIDDAIRLDPTSTVPTCAEGTSYYDAGDHDFCDCVGSSPAWRSRGGAGDCNGT